MLGPRRASILLAMASRVVHFEIPIDDPDRAGGFYGKVFGWNVAKWGPADYWTMTTGEEPGIGAEGALIPRAEASDGVLVYVGVDDIDRALAGVRDSGGSVVTDKTPIPAMGWSARFRDTEGNVVGLFQEDAAAGS